MNRAAKAKDRNLARMMSDPSKYDWFGAFSFHPTLKKTTLCRGVGFALMHLADNETLAVWASQETLAVLSGVASTRQVSLAVKAMVDVGAITKMRWRDVPSDIKPAIEKKMKRRKDSRGVVYLLRLEWATDTIAKYVETSPSEPTHLSAVRRGKKRTAIVKHSPDYGRPVSPHLHDDWMDDYHGPKLPDGRSPPDTLRNPQGGRPSEPACPMTGTHTFQGSRGNRNITEDAALGGLDARPASSDRVNRYAEAKGRVA